jgi:hypothetical protein
MVPDSSIDFAFTWDSLVHVERDIILSYVGELARVLVPGGFAFIHHSNLGAYPERLDDFHWARDLHARARTMSAPAMRQACEGAGLRCAGQELVPWGSTGLFIDAFSVITKSLGGTCPPTVVEENTGWGSEAASARRISRVYHGAAGARGA